jgi:hypothetical protein
MSNMIDLSNKWPNTCVPCGMFDMIELFYKWPNIVWHVACLIWLICLIYELIFWYHMSCFLCFFAWSILVLFVWFKCQMSMKYLFNWFLLRLNWPTLQPKSFIEITNICPTLNNIVIITTLEIKFHPYKKNVSLKHTQTKLLKMHTLYTHI